MGPVQVTYSVLAGFYFKSFPFYEYCNTVSRGHEILLISLLSVCNLNFRR